MECAMKRANTSPRAASRTVLSSPSMVPSMAALATAGGQKILVWSGGRRLRSGGVRRPLTTKRDRP
jgi:hypothetical protein